MKKLIGIAIAAFLLCLSVSTDAQCDTLRHNNTWFDGWISCTASANPNAARGNGHWIHYDFGQQYSLFELRIWNMNVPDHLNYGMQNVVIDISADGVTWTEFGQYVLPQAPGHSRYEGDVIMNFDTTNAQHVLITAIDNYGGSCYGLSEVRFRAQELCPEDKIEWIAGDGDWDVPSNWCGNKIPTADDEVVVPSGVKITVPRFYTANVWTITMDPSSELEVKGNLVAHKPE